MESPLARFRALQTELLGMLAGEGLDEEAVLKKMSRYIALMVENGEQQERMFDHFCEFGGVELLSKFMRGDPLLAVKCYSLLFINLRNEMWISYILCQPFLMEAISLQAVSADEEYTEYFVSFLKSLSIRINHSQVTLFYNKRNCTFPLAMAAMHYHNHPDFMVRTSVMNIVLELMKIQEPKTQLYFSRFPFTSYLVAFACEVTRLSRTLHSRLADPTLTAKQLTSYKVDLADYLYFFNDLVQFATPSTIQVIEQIVNAYFILPTFKRLLSQDERERTHALLMIHEGMRVIKSKVVLDSIALLLMKPQLGKATIERIQNYEQVFFPPVFRKQFDPAGSYWGDYQSEVVGHCLQVFKDVEKFEVSYEEQQHEANSKFVEEVGEISKFIGYDLLTGEVIGPRLQQQLEESADPLPNPFRAILLQLLTLPLSHAHALPTTLLLALANHPNVSPAVLTVIQLAISQGLSPLLQEVKTWLANSIRQIDWEKSRVATLSNILRLLELVMVESEEIEFEEDLLRNYREVTGKLREHVNMDNMQLLCDNFTSRETEIKTAKKNSAWEISLPYPPLFLPQERWDDSYSLHALPSKPQERAIHLVQHFFLFRSFVINYFTKFYDAEYPSFEAEYAQTFLATRDRWRRGEDYRISGRTLVCCMLESVERKNRRVTIIEDKFCFVLGELNEHGCRILSNEPWKTMNLQISRQEGTIVEATVGSGKGSERFRLIFEDQVRSGATLVRLNDLKWECCQFELAFIAKFLKAAAEE